MTTICMHEYGSHYIHTALIAALYIYLSLT